jgi:hypothetical protein
VRPRRRSRVARPSLRVGRSRHPATVCPDGWSPPRRRCLRRGGGEQNPAYRPTRPPYVSDLHIQLVGAASIRSASAVNQDVAIRQPETLWNWHPASINATTAPTKPMPLTPPTDRTRSTGFVPGAAFKLHPQCLNRSLLIHTRALLSPSQPVASTVMPHHHSSPRNRLRFTCQEAVGQRRVRRGAG